MIDALREEMEKLKKEIEESHKKNFNDILKKIEEMKGKPKDDHDDDEGAN